MDKKLYIFSIFFADKLVMWYIYYAIKSRNHKKTISVLNSNQERFTHVLNRHLSIAITFFYYAKAE